MLIVVGPKHRLEYGIQREHDLLPQGRSGLQLRRAGMRLVETANQQRGTGSLSVMTV